MQTETIKGSIKSYQDRTDWPGVTFPINFEVKVETYTDVDELRKAGAFPNDKDILDMVNAKIRAGKRAAKTTELTADLKTAYENSPAYKAKDFYASALRAGMDPKQAEGIARSTTGYDGPLS